MAGPSEVCNATAVATAAVAAAAPVEVWEPQPGVGAVLSGCVAVLAPSLWLEAWGMVVTEGLLRGLPALVSDLGGLPEAGMGMCPAVPVSPIRIPPGADGVPDWEARAYPPQDVGAWEHALLELLLGGATGSGEAGPVLVRTSVDGAGGRGERDVRVAGGGGRGAPGWSGEGGDVGAGPGCSSGGCAGAGVEGQAASEGAEEGGKEREEEGDVWERISRRGQRAALAHVGRWHEELVAFLRWLDAVGAAGDITHSGAA
ncbi:hypothetical protein TSOC_005993 [Tetrabaena socialis]|uniref:Glycosyl transferase family 1 domain-containing protein n=1 Tax=Tetrabaena socialis TaxID=47790 RepID=A0A2J8A4W8_9CHLO|nr:hypothetical protein TSOC_005993 [Tetrabaena socialis]|eukprot:PNH07561.1 hypothetical protein TSOC_005993 [Tetrabaena socialis]